MISLLTLAKEFVGQVCPVGSHGVGRCDGAECYCVFVSAFVAHYAYALYGQEDCAGLPYFVVEVPVAQTLDEDVVGLLEHVYFSGVMSPRMRTARPGPGNG